jgi:hypothetical protein
MKGHLFDIIEKSFVPIVEFLLKFICENIFKNKKNQNEIKINIKITFNIKK